MLLLPLTKKARRTERRHPETWALVDACYRGPVELATEYGKVYGFQTDLNQSIDAAAGVFSSTLCIPLLLHSSSNFNKARSCPSTVLLLLGPPYAGQNKLLIIPRYLIQRPESFRWNRSVLALCQDRFTYYATGHRGYPP